MVKSGNPKVMTQANDAQKTAYISGGGGYETKELNFTPFGGNK